MEKEQDEPTITEINEYQLIITQQIDVLTNTYETIDNEVLQIKIRAKISELIDCI